MSNTTTRFRNIRKIRVEVKIKDTVNVELVIMNEVDHPIAMMMKDTRLKILHNVVLQIVLISAG